MDPVAGIDITRDTTFVFLAEAEARGHENHYCGIEDLSFEDGHVLARSAPIRVKPVQGEHAEVGAYTRREAGDFDCVWMRKDPPFDSDFFFTTHLLSLIDEKRTFVFNRASGLREASEKMYILRFPDLIAESIIAATPETLLAFQKRVGGDIVVKPLDGCGGSGIFRLSPGDLNTRSILETITGEGRRQIMAQRYLPESRDGDMRLLYLDGKPLGAIRRVPRDDDLRGNIHVGGTCVHAPIGENERAICARLAPALDALGIYFAGLDVIGDYLSEVNVTSPTGIQEANALADAKLETGVVEFVERRCEALER